MPLHDWSTQIDEVFHDFHLSWSAHIKESLNRGLLPGDLYARCEANIAIDEGDGSDEYRREPDVSVVVEPFTGDPGGLLTTAAAPPQTDIVLEVEGFLRRQRTVAVRRASGRLVAAIEIASEANLSTLRRRETLVAKCAALVGAGVHVCLLNPHLLRGRVPSAEYQLAEALEMSRGLEGEIPRRSDAEAAMTSVAVAYPRARLYADHYRVGTPLRSLPLFVSEDGYVPLPLEETYMRTFAGLPRRVQAEMEARLSAGEQEA